MTSFDWEEFLRLAERILAAPQPDEAIQRTAINRTYYALFIAAKARLVQEGVPIPPKGTAHELVRRAYQSAPRGARRKIAQTGFRLLRLRRFADIKKPISQRFLDQMSSSQPFGIKELSWYAVSSRITADRCVPVRTGLTPP